jgi:hypothetical protein
MKPEEERAKPQAITKMGLVVDFDAGVVTGFTGITARIDEVIGCGPKKKPRQNRGGTRISVRGGKAYLLVAQCNTVFFRFAQGKSSLLAQSKEKAPPRTEPRQPGPSTKISNWPGSVRRYLSKPGRKRTLMEAQLANKL